MKHFLKSYLKELKDPSYIAIKGGMMVLVALLVWACLRTNPIGFVVGYILTDPFAYYIVIFRR